MMKKGFTLAEVLITLTIIGVVAVLTLPGLMTNTAEQQARAALKKMANTFSQAAEMNGAIAGYNYSGITTGGGNDGFDNLNEGSLAAVFVARLNVEQSKGRDMPMADGFSGANSAIYLKDGTAIYFPDGPGLVNTAIAADGLMVGIPVLFDTNGNKGPNLISSCTGAAPSDWAGDNGGDCRIRSRRFIKDIFMMRLRDASVYPLGAASTWMMDDREGVALQLNEYGGS